MRQGFESPTGYQLSQETAAERQAVFLCITPMGDESPCRLLTAGSTERAGERRWAVQDRRAAIRPGRTNPLRGTS